MKKYPLIASMMVIMVASIFAGAGTMAYFSGTAVSTGNTFTAGILKMEKVAFGPVTFTELKPGDTREIVIELKNTGDLDIKYLFMRDKGYTWSGGANLGNVIEVLNFKEYKIYPDGVSVAHGPESCTGATYEGWLPDTVADHDGHLSLMEFFRGYPAGTSGQNDYWDVVTLSANWGGGVLEVDYTYKMVIDLEFMESGHPQDVYQGTSCSFDLVVMGTHADKTEIEGYLP